MSSYRIEAPRANLSTDELATLARVRPQSIRAALCRVGHWLGLHPVKLPNGRLLWDAAAAQAVLSGGAL